MGISVSKDDELIVGLERKAFDARESIRRRLMNLDGTLSSVSVHCKNVLLLSEQATSYVEAFYPGKSDSAPRLNVFGCIEQSLPFGMALGMLLQMSITRGLRSLEHAIVTAAIAAKLHEKVCAELPRRHSFAIAAMLHDWGVSVVAGNHYGSAEEMEKTSQHVTIGFELALFFPGMVGELTKVVSRHHHERWNGQGFPDHLQGTAIPLEARIVGVADIFERVTRVLMLKPSDEREHKTFEFLGRQKAVSCDPDLVDAILGDLSGYLSLEHKTRFAVNDFVSAYGKNLWRK